MKILSAVFDTLLLPLDVAQDVLDKVVMKPKWKSDTRRRIEKIEENLKP